MTTPTTLTVPTTPAEIAARVHVTRLELALLTHRARAAAIAAVRAGWWNHAHAHQALTSAGLRGLPMIWPIYTGLRLHWRVSARDAEHALSQARTGILATLRQRLQDIGTAGPLTVHAVTPDQPDEEETGYAVSATATLELRIEATSADDATLAARRRVHKLLSGHDALTLPGGEHYLLPEDCTIWDLDPADLDPTAADDVVTPPTHDIPTDPAVLHRLTSALDRLTRALRAAVIDDIGEGIGPAAGTGGYDYADQILQAMDLDPLPRSWQFEITARLPVTVEASTGDEAVRASVRAVADIGATTPQRLLPITYTGRPAPHPEPQEIEPGRFRVLQTMAYLVCLRGSRSQALAEAAVRTQLSTFDPANAVLPLHTVALGQHVDRLLDRDTD